MAKHLIIDFLGTGDHSAKSNLPISVQDISLNSLSRNADHHLFYVEGCGQTNYDFAFPDISKTAQFIAYQLLYSNGNHPYNNDNSIGQQFTQYENKEHVGNHKNKRYLRPFNLSRKHPDTLQNYDSIQFIGFSRGCFTAIFTIKYLLDFYQQEHKNINCITSTDSLAHKVFLYCFDPIPGNLIRGWSLPSEKLQSISNKAKVLKELPIRFVLYAYSATTYLLPGFFRYLPETSLYTETDMLLLPGDFFKWATTNHRSCTRYKENILQLYLAQQERNNNSPIIGNEVELNPEISFAQLPPYFFTARQPQKSNIQSFEAMLAGFPVTYFPQGTMKIYCAHMYFSSINKYLEEYRFTTPNTNMISLCRLYALTQGILQNLNVLPNVRSDKKKQLTRIKETIVSYIKAHYTLSNPSISTPNQQSVDQFISNQLKSICQYVIKKSVNFYRNNEKTQSYTNFIQALQHPSYRCLFTIWYVQVPHHSFFQENEI
ncbi:hypothetical protein, partial [Fangia hongkongensis]